jgi:hypothetical protein
MTNTVDECSDLADCRPALSQDIASGQQSVSTISRLPRFLSSAGRANGCHSAATCSGAPMHDHAYDVRAKIYCQPRALPLIGMNFRWTMAFDQRLEDRHVVLGTAIGGLFAVNSVTGV